MKLFILGGLSHKNQEWITQVADSFAKQFECVVITYDHWKDESSIDYEHESKKLHAILKNEKQYAIFAKSAGILLTLKTIFDFDLKPTQCFFVGTPYVYSHKVKMPFEQLIYAIPLRSVFIQNEFDPACSYKKLVELLNGKFPILNIPEAASHDYDIETLKQMIKSF